MPSDELRILLLRAIDGIDVLHRKLLDELPERAFDKYLARQLDIISLPRIHAPASVVAMRHYVDFLGSLDLMTPRGVERSRAVCDRLWQRLKQALRAEWDDFKFLEAMYPGS